MRGLLESQRQGDNNFIRSAGGPWRAEKSTWAKSRNKESLFLSLGAFRVGRDRGKPDCDLVISDFMTPRQLVYTVLKTLPCESPVKLIKPSLASSGTLGESFLFFSSFELFFFRYHGKIKKIRQR